MFNNAICIIYAAYALLNEMYLNGLQEIWIIGKILISQFHLLNTNTIWKLSNIAYCTTHINIKPR